MEFLLRRMIMKTSISVFIALLIAIGGTYATGEVPPNGNRSPLINVDNNIDTTQSQQVTVVGGDSSSSAQGGDSVSASSSDAVINMNSNYETRTPPVSVFPPYLPFWNHGGWGTMKAYFPNGPNGDDQVYERVYDPENEADMRELRGILESLDYESPLGLVGGILNGVGAIFGCPDNYHHGRGFEIANSLIRTRRPKGKPLLVFIDSNVDTGLLEQAGYAYVGNISLEGKVDRSWDHVYEAAVAEAMPWNVDILLITGGMKGITVGSNISFPGAGGAYSQANYSISLFGSVSSGITEGKGKAMISAQGYRYWPGAVNRRKIPEVFYNKIRAKLMPGLKPQLEEKESTEQQVAAAPVEKVPEKSEPRPMRKPEPLKQQEPLGEQKPHEQYQPLRQQQFQGLEMSRELYDMAGLTENDHVAFLSVK
jgi:hypothetical protein